MMIDLFIDFFVRRSQNAESRVVLGISCTNRTKTEGSNLIYTTILDS